MAEVRFELEKSYRPWAVVFFLFGLGVVSVSLVLVNLIGIAVGTPSLVIGIMLWRLNPREYLIINPQGGTIRAERTLGNQAQVLRQFSLHDFVRLELVCYRVPRKGKRCMLVLVHRDGHLERLDDRPYKPDMGQIGKQVAAAAGLEFEDKGWLEV
ncbi:MAG TPA: hypothetical protein EYP85_05885 [Armatimonadetes bacterium]|nr:hypothetical protein [Armatimonadota bacterium]